MTKSKLSVLCVFATLLSNPLSAQDPVEDVLEGCASEIDAYCSLVTPGEGRLVACFYAHEDKLSTQCLNALYDGAVALQQAVNALVYLATSCEQDIDKFCGAVEPGEGRILNCITSQRDSLSETCASALQDLEE